MNRVSFVSFYFSVVRLFSVNLVSFINFSFSVAPPRLMDRVSFINIFGGASAFLKLVSFINFFMFGCGEPRLRRKREREREEDGQGERKKGKGAKGGRKRTLEGRAFRRHCVSQELPFPTILVQHSNFLFVQLGACSLNLLPFCVSLNWLLFCSPNAISLYFFKFCSLNRLSRDFLLEGNLPEQ